MSNKSAQAAALSTTCAAALATAQAAARADDPSRPPYVCESRPDLVSRSQTAFFRFSLWWRKKGLGDLTIEFACDEIPSFWGALIAGDEPKRAANDLWGCASY